MGRTDLEILGLSYDSRQVQRGHLFAALHGAKQDGLEFVKSAKRRGSGRDPVRSDASCGPPLDRGSKLSRRLSPISRPPTSIGPPTS